jgi:hypothetical protein
MKTIAIKSFVGMVLLAVLGLNLCCVATWADGNDEEKKLKVEDTTPPVTSNVKVSDVTETTAKISWETDEPAKDEIIWGLTDNIKETKWVMHEEFTTTHSLKITDLLPSTLYYYWTASGDANNNWKISAPSTFTTLAE